MARENMTCKNTQSGSAQAAASGTPPDAVVQARVPDELNRRTDLLRGIEHEPDHRPQAGAPAGHPGAV